MHLVGALGLACLPREDLSSYSGSLGGASGSSQNLPGQGGRTADAGVEPNGGQSGEGNPVELPLDPGAGDASALAMDAGTQPRDAAADGGSLTFDAGPFANQCSDTQGTLVPNTNVCLFFAAEPRVSWQAAALACQTRNSTLVSVKTLERDGFLSSLIDTEIWLGATDTVGMDPATNVFLWPDLTQVDVNMETWAASEPDGVAGQFCVSKYPPTMGGQWRDRPCNDLKAYVCEQTF